MGNRVKPIKKTNARKGSICLLLMPKNNFVKINRLRDGILLPGHKKSLCLLCGVGPTLLSIIMVHLCCQEEGLYQVMKFS